MKKDGTELEYVPIEFKDRRMCLAALTSSNVTSFIFGMVLEVNKNKNVIDEEICLAALKIPNIIFSNIPQEFRTRSVCLAACKSSIIYFNLKDVPKEIIDEEICLAAAQNDGTALLHVPDIYKKVTIWQH